MKRNVKRVEIVVPHIAILGRLRNTPTLRRLVRTELKVGSNIEHMNHNQFSQVKNLYTVAGCTVNDLTNYENQ